ncbi:MAG: hypothetical protein MN733_35765 [Nitrososphaera sp.]|nr:hypothetical protein [Nitrososphaera sp.]
MEEEAGQAARQALKTTRAIRGEGSKADALSRLAGDNQALDITIDAIQTARFAGRREVFNALAQGAVALAAKDGGQTLWEVYGAILKVEAWWQA